MAVRGEAGRVGEDVRSDLHVSVTIKETGGREVDVSSKVGAYYGRSIDQVTNRVLDAFGIEHAHVVLDDSGALPFVIAARMETALRRAGVETKSDSRPERNERDGHASTFPATSLSCSSTRGFIIPMR
jgi:citrate lyase subunit beta/citryl-CoA lyase